MRVLITGAAGNLGTHVTRYLLSTKHQLRLLEHRKPIDPKFKGADRVEVWHGDLDRAESLAPACDAVNCIVHLAGVLFAPNPAEFLPRTNIGYVENLLAAARSSGVEKFILVSFPHVEGETTPEHRATNRLQCNSGVIHFRTRLEAERRVLAASEQSELKPVIFRSGVVYGRDIKLIEGARQLLRLRLLAVWRQPTWVHLVALPDFLTALRVAIERDDAAGVYNICDDQPILLQDFLDRLANRFGYPRPRRLPRWMFMFAGAACELFAGLFGTTAPLTRDIIRAGMTSAVADSSRMKQDLLPVLAYPTIERGIMLL